MGDIVPFKRKTLAEKHKGNTLCRSGFHKWGVCKEKQFDTRQGKLVSIYRCTRCGAVQVKSQ